MEITNEVLDRLADFGKERNGRDQYGHYSDRWQFSIVKFKSNSNVWSFCLFSEDVGSLHVIKELRDVEDLKNLYKAITDKELKFI